MQSFSLIMLLFLIAIGITGCGEETGDPITATKTEDALFGSLSEMKELAEMAPGAPVGTNRWNTLRQVSRLLQRLETDERIR